MNDWLAIHKANITRLLTPMKVPAMRRDLDKPENIHWLIRNLGINNSGHEDYKVTIAKLVSLNGLMVRPMSDVLLPRWNDTLIYIYPQLDYIVDPLWTIPNVSWKGLAEHCGRWECCSLLDVSAEDEEGGL